jgi:hypothetical protein
MSGTVPHKPQLRLLCRTVPPEISENLLGNEELKRAEKEIQELKTQTQTFVQITVQCRKDEQERSEANEQKWSSMEIRKRYEGNVHERKVIERNSAANTTRKPEEEKNNINLNLN